MNKILPLIYLIIKTTANNVDNSIKFEDVFSHECHADGMVAYIKRSDLAKLGSWGDNFSALSLNSNQCAGVLMEDNETIQFNAGTWASNKTECETILESNGGVKTFWNMVQYTPEDDSVITRDTEGLFNFSCTYDMDASNKIFELSLAHKITAKAVDTIKFAGLESKGEFSATMELYRDRNYTSSFAGANEVSISLDQQLYIEVKLNSTDDDIALTLVDCWATPGPNAGHQMKHTLLEDGCSKDPTVEILQSGIDQTARWSSQMFEFIQHDSVWLHCDVRACHKIKERCESLCEVSNVALFELNNRKKRASGLISTSLRSKREVSIGADGMPVVVKGAGNHVYDPNILTVGPVVSLERSKALNKAAMGPVTGITIAGVIIALAMIYGIYRVLALKHAEEAKIIEANNNNEVGADWNLYGKEETAAKQNPMNVY